MRSNQTSQLLFIFCKIGPFCHAASVQGSARNILPVNAAKCHPLGEAREVEHTASLADYTPAHQGVCPGLQAAHVAERQYTAAAAVVGIFDAHQGCPWAVLVICPAHAPAVCQCYGKSGHVCVLRTMKEILLIACPADDASACLRQSKTQRVVTFHASRRGDA